MVGDEVGEEVLTLQLPWKERDGNRGQIRMRKKDLSQNGLYSQNICGITGFYSAECTHILPKTASGAGCTASPRHALSARCRLKNTALVASYPLSTPNTRFNTKKEPNMIRLTK